MSPTATFKKAIDRAQKAVKSGQVRQFTGNDYAPLLAKGDVWAAFAWSGDMVQLQADHPHLKWNLPDSGRDDLDRQHAHPQGRGRVHRLDPHELLLRARRGGEVEDYVNYICPVSGADTVLRKTDPTVAKNTLIFPTKEMLANAHQVDPKAVNNQDYKQQFQNLVGA